ncbi:unnamed protein product [Owenia fusiformis]|nr:unnamed protein product [Owenia fusiformis]
MQRAADKLIDTNGRAKLSLITYSKDAEEIIHKKTAAEFKTALTQTDIHGGTTCNYLKAETYKALSMVRNGTYFDDVQDKDGKTIPRGKFVVVLTDGISFDRKSNMAEALSKTKEQIELLRGSHGGIKYITLHFDVTQPGDTRLGNVEIDAYDPVTRLSLTESDPLPALMLSLSKYICEKKDVPVSCNNTLDIVYIMDRSKSINVKDIKFVKQFFIDLTEKLMSAAPDTNIGAISYFGQIIHEFKLGEFKTKEEVIEAIGLIPEKTGKYTHTNYALERARTHKDYFGIARGKEPDGIRNRKEFGDVIVLSTDGRTWLRYGGKNEHVTPTQGKLNVKAGIQQVIIGLPNANDLKDGIIEWEKVQPNPNLIFNLQTEDYTPESFKKLLTITSEISATACSATKNELVVG